MTWPEAIVAVALVAGVVVIAWRALGLLGGESESNGVPLDLSSEREGTWMVEREAPEAAKEKEER